MTAADDESASVEDPELLMEVMEARERVDEVEQEEELAALKSENEERRRESVGKIEEACGRGEWGEVEREVVRLRYWENIRESIEGWEGGRAGSNHH